MFGSPQLRRRAQFKIGLGLWLGCVLAATQSQVYSAESPQSTEAQSSTATEASQAYDFRRLHYKLAIGQANLAEVRKSLTDTNPVALSNIAHALYGMRWHRGVVRLLDGLWALDKEKYPELAWEQIAKPPVRIAIASTINRVHTINTATYLDYIRTFKHDDRTFNRAQVVVALGFNGHESDLSYLGEMSRGDNRYVTQSAVTALGLFGGESARELLIGLLAEFADTPRGDLIRDVLRQAYDWSPVPKQSPVAGS